MLNVLEHLDGALVSQRARDIASLRPASRPQVSLRCDITLVEALFGVGQQAIAKNADTIFVASACDDVHSARGQLKLPPMVNERGLLS